MEIQVNSDDLRAVLDYAQPDEEHDYDDNPDETHIVHPMRRLRLALDLGSGVEEVES